MNHSHHRLSDESLFLKKVANLEQHRMETLSFEEVYQLLDIQSTDCIADLGAGTGYFSFPLADRAEKVITVDSDDRMLAYIDEQMKKEQLANIQSYQGFLTDLPLKDHSVDKVLASLVLHEVTPLTQALHEIKRILKPGGRFLCIEIEPDSHSHHPRISKIVMKQHFQDTGFTILDERMPTETIYTLLATL